VKIDLNSDMGEGFGPYRLCDDEAMMKIVSSANLACGFHGGDPETMARMVRLAKENGVGIGAHPGLPDRSGFGRREMPFQPDELRQQMLYQLGALIATARSEGMTVGHFSFHAAMGNMVNRDAALADLMMNAISTVDPRLVVFVTSGSEIEKAARRAKLKTLALFLAEDLAFYTLHYVDHHCRLFWAGHVTHHSSEHFNLTTGFRSSVFQPLYRFIYFIPLTLVGFNPADIIVMYSITQIYGIIVHTEYVGKLGWLEYIFVTPSHHRVHHASNVQYLDKNMGMCLIIWDRIFGTFQKELPAEPPRYGLTKSMEQQGLGQTVFHEWKAISQDFMQPVDFKTKLKYLLKAPGWSPDGSRETSKDLQRKLADLTSAAGYQPSDDLENKFGSRLPEAESQSTI